MTATIIWVSLLILGIITGIWYPKSPMFDPRGRKSHPPILSIWVLGGHLISWLIIILGIFAAVMLTRILTIRTIFLILGIALLCFSLWGWLGFFLTIRRKIPFQIATPCQFLALTFVSLGLILHEWIVAVLGVVGAWFLYIYLRKSLAWSRRERKEEESELISHFTQDLMTEPLYGMVKVMCTSYFIYTAGWKDTRGEESLKSIYSARYALHSRNRFWNASQVNSFLGNVGSFEELLLAICAQPDEMPNRVEELRQWLKNQKEVNIPSVTWTKEEALESDIGSMENLGFEMKRE